jgi:hypothetical protein
MDKRSALIGLMSLALAPGTVAAARATDKGEGKPKGKAAKVEDVERGEKDEKSEKRERGEKDGKDKGEHADRGGKPTKAKGAAEKAAVTVGWADVPAAVRRTLWREGGGGAPIETVDREKRDRKTVYEADVEVDGRNYEVVVARDGTLIHKTLDEAPEADARPAAAKSGRGDETEGKAEK